MFIKIKIMLMNREIDKANKHYSKIYKLTKLFNFFFPTQSIETKRFLQQNTLPSIIPPKV